MSKKKSNVTQNKTLKATIWYLVCEFVLKGISFITMPIFTRMMTSEEIGSFSILASWISILSVIVTLNLIQSVFLAKYDFADRYDFGFYLLYIYISV